MDNTEGHDPSVLGSIPSRTSFYGICSVMDSTGGCEAPGLGSIPNDKILSFIRCTCTKYHSLFCSTSK